MIFRSYAEDINDTPTFQSKQISRDLIHCNPRNATETGNGKVEAVPGRIFVLSIELGTVLRPFEMRTGEMRNFSLPSCSGVGISCISGSPHGSRYIIDLLNAECQWLGFKVHWQHMLQC